MHGPGSPPRMVDRRRQRMVMAGLLLTFLGIVGVGFAIPVGPDALTHLLPFVAAGCVSLWVGGILLGVARPSRRSRSPP